MKRLLHVFLICSVVAYLCGCGSKFFVGGALNSSTVKGTVSIVQVTTVVDGGALVTVTLVTLLQDGSSRTMNFCGDQRIQFPLDHFVQANFTPGTTCASVVEIVVIG